jgi:hypothetical protein
MNKYRIISIILFIVGIFDLWFGMYLIKDGTNQWWLMPAIITWIISWFIPFTVSIMIFNVED